MAAPKGHPRYGGRTKGTPNKVNSVALQAVQEICAREKCDPITGMCRIAEDKSAELTLRFQCYKELAGYLYAKRKAVEVSGLEKSEVDVNLSVNQERVQTFEHVLKCLAKT